MEEPKWLSLAKAQIGVKEAPGYANNPIVQKYYEDAGSGKMPDSVPWCAAFVGAMLKRAGIEGTGLLAARSYLNWGHKLNQPILMGAIVVMKRGSSSWQGHVAFFIKDNGDGTIKVVGGNQNDAVTVANYSKNKVLGYRWPIEAPVFDRVLVAIQKHEGFFEGSRAWRNNNPGNIKYGKFAIEHGAADKDDQNHAIFPSLEIGKTALKHLLYEKYAGQSLKQIGVKYAEDPNWANSVAKIANVHLDEVVIPTEPAGEDKRRPLPSP